MVTHAYINAIEHTKGIRKFYDHFRMWVKYFPIEILRNPLDAQAGIWIVADDVLIPQLVNSLIQVIKEFETTIDTSFSIVKDKMKGTKKEKKAQLRRMIMQQLNTRGELSILKELQRDTTWTLRQHFFEVGKDKDIRLMYIKQTPSLHNLKRLKCKS